MIDDIVPHGTVSTYYIFVYWNIKIIILTIHTTTADCSSVWTSPVFVAFRQELFMWRGLTQTRYFVSESQRNLRRAVCLSPPLLNTCSFVKTRYVTTEYTTFERNCDGSCSSVVQRSHDSDCSDWNLPSFLLVSHGRIASTCAYSLPFRSHASSFTIARTHCRLLTF